MSYIVGLVLSAYITASTTDRFTSKEAKEVANTLTPEIHKLERRVDALPPRELTERLVRIELKLSTMTEKIAEVEKTMENLARKNL